MVSEYWVANERTGSLDGIQEAEPFFMRRRQHGWSQTDGSGETTRRGYNDTTMARMRQATGETLLVPSRNRRSREPYSAVKLVDDLKVKVPSVQVTQFAL
jgi:hypothetical protein